MNEDEIPLQIKPVPNLPFAGQDAPNSVQIETPSPLKSDNHPRFVGEVESGFTSPGANEVPFFLGNALPTRSAPRPSQDQQAVPPKGVRARPAISVGLMLLVVVLALFLIWMVQAVVGWSIRVSETHPVLGMACNALFAIGAGLIVILIAREVRSYLRLLRLGDIQIQLGRARVGQIASKDDDYLKIRLRSVAERMKANGTISEETNRDILTTMTDSNLPGDWVEPACRCLLRTMDDRVKALIESEARLIGVGTALSPSGPLDTAIALWRNSRLVFQIAEIYGVRPHGYQSFRLLRRVVSNTVVAGLSQEAMQMLYAAYGPAAVEAASRGFRCIFDWIYRGGMMLTMVEPVSGSIIAASGAFGKGASDFAGAAAAQVSGPLLQGLLNAVLTVRIGLVAQNECRLLSMTDEERRIESASIISTLLGFFLSVRSGTGALAASTQDNRDEVSS